MNYPGSVFSDCNWILETFKCSLSCICICAIVCVVQIGLLSVPFMAFRNCYGCFIRSILVIACLLFSFISCSLVVMMCRSGKEGLMLVCQTLLPLQFVAVFAIWLLVKQGQLRKQIAQQSSRYIVFGRKTLNVRAFRSFS